MCARTRVCCGNPALVLAHAAGGDGIALRATHGSRHAMAARDERTDTHMALQQLLRALHIIVDHARVCRNVEHGLSGTTRQSSEQQRPPALSRVRTLRACVEMLCTPLIMSLLNPKHQFRDCAQTKCQVLPHAHQRQPCAVCAASRRATPELVPVRCHQTRARQWLAATWLRPALRGLARSCGAVGGEQRHRREILNGGLSPMIGWAQ